MIKTRSIPVGRAQKDEGMTLLMTMITLFLVSMLVLSGMQTMLLYQRGLNHHLEHNERMNELEFQVEKLAIKKWAESKHCLIEKQDPNHVIDLVQTRGCVLSTESMQFLYLVEDLGVYPCLMIQLGQKQFSSKHFRINMLTNEGKRMFLQVRIAQPIPLLVCEAERTRPIPLGMLSWRYLTQH